MNKITIEIRGTANTGKTCLALLIARELSKLGKPVSILDDSSEVSKVEKLSRLEELVQSLEIQVSIIETNLRR